jgi:hypothetical protein
VDIEFQVHALADRIVLQILDQRTFTREGIMIAHGARLTFMGRELPHSTVTGSPDTVYFFSVRIPDEVPVDDITNLLWDLMTARDPEGLITKIGVITKTKLQPVDLQNPGEGKRAVEAAVRDIQAHPIPKAHWLGE